MSRIEPSVWPPLAASRACGQVRTASRHRSGVGSQPRWTSFGAPIPQAGRVTSDGEGRTGQVSVIALPGTPAVGGSLGQPVGRRRAVHHPGFVGVAPHRLGLGVSVSVVADVVPAVVLAPLAGAVVERLPRVTVMVVADLARVVLVAILALWHAQLGVVYAVVQSIGVDRPRIALPAAWLLRYCESTLDLKACIYRVSAANRFAVRVAAPSVGYPAISRILSFSSRRARNLCTSSRALIGRQSNCTTKAWRLVQTTEARGVVAGSTTSCCCRRTDRASDGPCQAGAFRHHRWPRSGPRHSRSTAKRPTRGSRSPDTAASSERCNSRPSSIRTQG